MKDCLHLDLRKLAPNDPANELHNGPEVAYHCDMCGSVFFVSLTPATIHVFHGTPPRLDP